MNTRRRTQSDYTGFTAIVSIILILGFAYGWIANIITIIGMGEILNGEGVIRIIGVFIAPLGAIMGYF